MGNALPLPVNQQQPDNRSPPLPPPPPLAPENTQTSTCEMVVVRCRLFITSGFGRLLPSFLMANALPPPPPPSPPENNHYPSSTTTLQEHDTQISTCEICIEPMQLPVCEEEKFRFLLHCDHPFCSECMIKYIIAKLDDNIGNIPCPALNCKQFLDPLVCQPLIDPKVFVKWCDVLCESTIMDLETSYCPNRNCSALIVNECCDNKINKARCPSCKKHFCFMCMHPWHGVLRCDESQEFRESGDLEFGILAKKKGWKRCPRCRHFVELVDGCEYIICRCGTRFCYLCGLETSGCKCQGSGWGCDCGIIIYMLLIVGIAAAPVFIGPPS